MSNPVTLTLTLTDFETLFHEEEGVDQILAAICWLECTSSGEHPIAGEMREAVCNAPASLVNQLESLIREAIKARRDGDPDLEETATVDAWDLLILRDRLEDLRPVRPELFGEDAVVSLAEFDSALDRADVWLEDLDAARVQMGVETGKTDRRWWCPREDFGSPEWDLPAEAHPDRWVPTEEEVASWREGKLAPARAAAVSRHMAKKDDEKE
ncbi:MAG: hypothetical protein COU34_05450 [Candidatus Magasanikbacteria bacterium CG10_big_fil_rev_8_21_14_0_10_43_9]|nr:MAG: hypothetical protein COU34_05450 [Candidatus Magasanikbacteria bacterium CG10_big_fil_rev_8_21_14_0_10_43_9]